MEHYFKKNVPFFEKRASSPPMIDWRGKNVMVASVCLGAVKNAVVCFAASRPELGENFLQQSQQLVSEAMSVFESARERDEVGLDRPAITLASRLAQALAPDLSIGKSPVPFEAFSTYIEAAGRLLEEVNAARVLWALFAVLEGRSDEYSRARDRKLRTHLDFREEMPLVHLLPELHERADHPGWARYETVFARWLNPVLTTDSYASNFRDEFAGVMSLLWARDHLKRLERETLLRTYFGETLTIPAPVN